MHFDAPAQLEQLGELAVHRQLGADAGALVHERGHQHFPPLVLRPDQIGLGHAHVLEEHLVELRVPGHLYERSDAHARGLHIHGQATDAAVFGRVRVGAHEQLDEVRAVGEAGPHLLTVHHENVAVLDRARLHGSEVRTGVGLGQALAPDFIARQDAGQIAPFLFVGAPVNQRGTRHHEPQRIGETRGVRLLHLLIEDEHLHQAGAAAAVFLGPVNAHPAVAVRRLLPRALILEARIRVDLVEMCGVVARGQVGGEPRAQLLTKGFFFGTEVEIHPGLLGRFRLASPAFRVKMRRAWVLQFG